MVCGKEAQYRWNTGNFQISQSDCILSGGTKMLYYIHQTPLSSWRVEGGSGDETIHVPDDIWGSQRLGTRLVNVFEYCCVASPGFS